MFEKVRNKKDNVKFAITPSDRVVKAQIAGDFSRWKAQPMRKQKDGSFSCTITLPKGTYEYKFLLDGQWVVDPDNNAWAMNPYGTVNSVAQID